MRRQLLVLSMICVVLFLAASPAQDQRSSAATTTLSSEVPRLVKFSGTVKDGAGHPRSGVVGITFALYKDEQRRRGGNLKSTKTEASAKLLPMHPSLKHSVQEWRSQSLYNKPEDSFFLPKDCEDASRWI